MSADTPPRARTIWALLWPLLALSSLLRGILYLTFRDTPFEITTLAWVLLVGALLDVLAYTLILSPAILGLTLFSMQPHTRKVLAAIAVVALAQFALYRWTGAHAGHIGALVSLALSVGLGLSLAAGWILSRPRLRRVALVAWFGASTFGTAIEYFFFEEFNSRYNHIALDYVLYPSEVATNIWESYPVVLFVAVALAAGLGLAWIADRRAPQAPLPRVGWSLALKRGLFAAVGLCVLGFAAACVPASLASDRITSEIAQNGLLQLVRAFRTAELEYDQYYPTIPSTEARARAAKVLEFPPSDGTPLLRTVQSARAPLQAPLDVVVVIEESLGSEFIGALGAERADLTPEFDRWSREGLLLESLIANGNRTVRGLEGVLCSFVPLPGDSITKRSPPAQAATLARVFEAFGYETAFFYGGAGTFDGMEPFMSANGWNSFVEERDYPRDCFKTAWGVADEHIFDALLERQVAAAASGRRFFGTVMSVSNHKPYLVPAGRTAIADAKPSRSGAVSYSDWALGHWLEAARERGLLQHTLVLVVGDHGARVYGRELIPVPSYRIPALFLSPDPAWRGKRFAPLCSQVDLAPTLLALSGLSADVPFLGRDLTRAADRPGRAFVQHNRDIGLVTDDLLVVLGLRREVTFYRRTGPGGHELALVGPGEVDQSMRELERDAVAVFQYAYETYRKGLYLPPAPAH